MGMAEQVFSEVLFLIIMNIAAISYIFLLHRFNWKPAKLVMIIVVDAAHALPGMPAGLRLFC